MGTAISAAIRLSSKRRGWAEDLSGYWAVDHVIQRHKGGLDGTENFLPACTRCNRLRWHCSGEDIRELLLLEFLASRRIKYVGKHGSEKDSLSFVIDAWS